MLSPISNDPNFDYIGMGTRIFLAGAQGYVIGAGTQHNPQNNFSTLMVTGDMKKMSNRFLRAATFHKYGPSLYLGIGIPIPVLNEKLARSTAVRDRDITVPVVDYGIPAPGPTLFEDGQLRGSEVGHDRSEWKGGLHLLSLQLP